MLVITLTGIHNRRKDPAKKKQSLKLEPDLIFTV